LTKCVNLRCSRQLHFYIVVQDEEVRPEASVTSELSSDVSQHEVNDAQVQLMEQEKMLLHLKDMIRECEQSLATKDAELEVCSVYCCRDPFHILSILTMRLASCCQNPFQGDHS